MGRGRQKAKHTKVARQLKYSVPETDYSQLERELGGSNSDIGPSSDISVQAEPDELSKWSEYVDEESDSDDEYDDYQPRRA